MQDQHSESQTFALLHEHIRKPRNNQPLSHDEIKQLSHKLSLLEKDQLIRAILRDKSIYKRSCNDTLILMQCLKQYKVFQQILQQKGEKSLIEICKCLCYARYDKNKYVYETGEQCDKFCIIMSGTVSVLVTTKQQTTTDQGETKTQSQTKQIQRYQKGQIFGQTLSKSKQLISKRVTSVYTTSMCQFFELKKRDYETINKHMIVSQMRQKHLFFESIQKFGRLNRNNFEVLMYLIKPRQTHIGNILYGENEVLDEIYIVKKGQFKLETVIYNDQIVVNDLMKLKSRNVVNKRKFQTAIVGEKFILGEVDVLMGGKTKESCTCITEKAEVYVIKKKDLNNYFQNGSIAEKEVRDKSYLRDEKLRTLNKTFNSNNSIKNTFVYRKDLFEDYKFAKSVDNYNSSAEKRKSITYIEDSRNYNFNNSSNPSHLRNTSELKNKSILVLPSHKRSYTQEAEIPNEYISEMARINQIIKQKKKYSKIRKNNDEPLFKFSNEIPIYLRVKMGVTHSTLKFQESKNQSSKTLTGFPSTLKLSKNPKPTRKFIKKEDKVSANPKTIYGKFFQLMLDV